MRSKLWGGGVIVRSCKLLSDKQILATLQLGTALKAAGQFYRCLGCAPRCRRCLETVRALMAQAHLDNCQVGFAACPVADARHDDGRTAVKKPVPVAAE